MEFGVDLDQTAVDLRHGISTRIHVTFFTGYINFFSNFGGICCFRLGKLGNPCQTAILTIIRIVREVCFCSYGQTQDSDPLFFEFRRESQ